MKRLLDWLEEFFSCEIAFLCWLLHGDAWSYVRNSHDDVGKYYCAECNHERFKKEWL